MDPSTTSILFGILLYLLYVLVPLIPAIIIYKIFPEGNVSAQGMLGQLKINATGAFAAYLIIIIIGFFIIKNTQDLINKHIVNKHSYDNSAWYVKSKVQLLEKLDNQLIPSYQVNNDSIKLKLDVKSTPDYNKKEANEVSFTTYYEQGRSSITFSYPGYEPCIVPLDPDSVKFNHEMREIQLGLIKLIKITQPYNVNNSIPANPSNLFQTVPEFNVPDF